MDLPPDGVVAADGIFLIRAELDGASDLALMLDLRFAGIQARMARRDGCPAEPENRRCRQGRESRLSGCASRARADRVIDNSDRARPVITRG